MNFININIIHASAIVAIRSLRSRLGYRSVSAAIVAILSIVSLSIDTIATRVQSECSMRVSVGW